MVEVPAVPRFWAVEGGEEEGAVLHQAAAGAAGLAALQQLVQPSPHLHEEFLPRG